MPVSLFSSRRLGALLLGLAAVACTDEASVDRPGTWRSTGVNDQNLRAMIADPRDLSSGVPATTTRGNGASRAVTRLYIDRRRQLLDVSTSQAAQTSTSSDNSALPAGGSGASQ